MSLPEVLLWRELRRKPLGLRFRRQFPIAGYVADFACIEVRVLVEIDGIVHDMGESPEHDVRRDGILTAKGWQVLRVSAKEVLGDVARVVASIISFAEGLRPLRPCGAPPRSGEALE